MMRWQILEESGGGKAQTIEVVIPAEIAKTGRREVINNLEENFWAWWAQYGREDLLRPSNIEPKWKRIRILAATADKDNADALARLPIKTLLARPDSQRPLQRWPWNARRRTFCTYHVAKHQNAAKTALILRHRGAPETLHNSYRGTGVTEEQGRRYFELMPEPAIQVIRPDFIPKGIVRIRLEEKRLKEAAAPSEGTIPETLAEEENDIVQP